MSPSRFLSGAAIQTMIGTQKLPAIAQNIKLVTRKDSILDSVKFHEHAVQYIRFTDAETLNVGMLSHYRRSLLGLLDAYQTVHVQVSRRAQ